MFYYIQKNFQGKSWNEVETVDNNYHIILKEQKISNLNKNFYNFIQARQTVNQLKITQTERMFYFRIKDLCFPIGYDKFHFLYSNDNNEKTDSEKIKILINRIKGNIYYNLIKVATFKDTTHIIDHLPINEFVKNYFTELKEKFNTYFKQKWEQEISKMNCNFVEKWDFIKKELIKKIQKTLI